MNDLEKKEIWNLITVGDFLKGKLKMTLDIL